MRAGSTALCILGTLATVPCALAEPSPRPADPRPVIACASLANLRAVLRSANDDAAAAVPIITDPKSDLGCSVLDRTTVTGVADHVALNGRAYDCLSQQGTGVCHWTVAGSARPVPPDAPKASPPMDKGADKGRRPGP